MSILIKSKCIDTKCREEGRQRAQDRRQEDIRSGLTKTNAGPQRGDFKLCRDTDKILSNYKRFKDPQSREKIKNEYFQAQKEARHG